MKAVVVKVCVLLLLLLDGAYAQESRSRVPTLTFVASSGGPSKESSESAPLVNLESSSSDTKLPDLMIPREYAPRRETRKQHFDWQAASTQSFYFLAMEHGFRLTQDKTRRNLAGRFFHEWSNAVAGLDGWGDGDGFLTNYIGHPIQGAITGWIQIQNDPRGIGLEFGGNKPYWGSRLRAGGWSMLYSTQFELGPVSEASIGRVGYVDGRRGQAGAVDLVMTPIAGMGIIVAEDAIDKYWVKKLESDTDNIPLRRFIRIALNPNRSFANLLRFKVPWHRDTRSLRHDMLLSTDGLKDSTPAK